GAVDARARIRVGRLAAWFAAFRVVADYDGLVVGEGGLEPSVGAEDDAELLPEEGEAEVEAGGEEDDGAEGGEVSGRSLQHELIQPGQRDEVREEHMGEEG